MHACEDFLDVVVKGHLNIAAVKEMDEFSKCDSIEVEEKYTAMFEGIEELA